MPTVQQAAEQWQSLLAANDCPPGLQPQRAALQHLLQLVRTRLTGTVLSAEERVLLQQLKAPQADLLLAPAYALEPWLSAAS